ncbi:MAG: acyl-CoA dehydrogenase family protein, partial [Planctomycetota bacterium]
MDEERVFLREPLEALARDGLVGAPIPAAYGGAGMSNVESVIVYEEIGRVCSSTRGFLAVQVGLVAQCILDWGSEEQKQRWLPKMATGELVGAIAMTEPNTGSDLQAVSTTAVKDGNDYVINGSKTYITNGQHADLVIVVAKTGPGEGSKGISLIVIETEGNVGFKRGRNLKKMGMPAADTSELFFEDCRVPIENRLGEDEGKGFI